MRFAHAPPPTPLLAHAEQIQAIEAALDPAWPAAAPAIEVAGAGKLLAALTHADLPGLVLKRLPPFPSSAARTHHARAVDAYRLLLQDRIGLHLPPQQWVAATTTEGAPVLYVVQAHLPADTFMPALLAHLDDEQATRLLAAIASSILRVWHRNAIDGPAGWTGLDARVDNWAVSAEGDKLSLRYVDTAVPLLRRAGRDLLVADLFLQTIPAPFVRFFRDRLQHALIDRYELRVALLDFAGSLHASGQEARIPLVVNVVNRLLATDENAELFVDPIRLEEVERYWRRSMRFWTLFHAAGRLGRFARTTLLRRPFPSVLPEPA